MMSKSQVKMVGGQMDIANRQRQITNKIAEVLHSVLKRFLFALICVTVAWFAINQTETRIAKEKTAEAHMLFQSRLDIANSEIQTLQNQCMAPKQ